MSRASFEHVVEQFYESLYRFALSLTQREAEASDLTQQTFYLWATKGHQLRDPSKLKSWLFTTLHREFLGSRRRFNRFPHYEMDEVNEELPVIQSSVVRDLDASEVVRALSEVDEVYRAPLILFYLEDHSYKEIAEILGIPAGTVMSRLARGKADLRRRLADGIRINPRKVVPMNAAGARSSA